MYCLKVSLFLIEYILNPNPNERPDIFQVSWVAYKLMGRDTPIVNVFVSCRNVKYNNFACLLEFSNSYYIGYTYSIG